MTMTATDAQVRIIMRERETGRTQEQAAANPNLRARTLPPLVAPGAAVDQAQVAILEQVHRPGEVLQTDGTWLTELGVTIQGQPFKHILIHSVLPYSNWEWGRIAQSESLAALRIGLQRALLKLRDVPQAHQHDN